MSQLLHQGYLKRIPLFSKYFRKQLLARTAELEVATKGLADPNVSIVIRSKNNAEQLRLLFEDLAKQKYTGEIEYIVIDTESTDHTRDVARQCNAKLISISQSDFSYPKALNLGFEAASHDWILTLVDHSLLVSDQVLKTATRAAHQQNVGAIAGFTLPNANATLPEHAGSILYLVNRVNRSAKVVPKNKLFSGILAANSSLISRPAWKEVGGFDETFGAGGEDSALARTLADAGYSILVDPALGTHHTHGLGWVDSMRQVSYWMKLGKPVNFDASALKKYRPDLRL